MSRNSWRTIRKARKGVSPLECWVKGFILGVVTTALMSGLFYLFWNAF